ncbi:MAG: metallophosphoesterase [Ruminococcus sp.]|nr:metallophosphoesterase [Ruminococcus sp.]
MKKLRISAIVLLIIILLYAWGFALKPVNYSVKSEKISNLKIVFISDLHNCFFGGKDQSGIFKNIKKSQPDLVLFGGDVIDGWSGTEYSLRLMKMVAEEYPCAYTAGNHEEMREDEEEFFEEVRKLDIPVLNGDFTEFDINNQKIRVYGIIDYHNFIQEYELNPDYYNILLLHQPEQFEPYNPDLKKFDLILSGHAHGGQWRIPFILEQGLYAPDQGLFPNYTTGKYEYGVCTHIISRGLAKPLRMIFIPRIFNRPELSVIDIS